MTDTAYKPFPTAFDEVDAALRQADPEFFDKCYNITEIVSKWVSAHVDLTKSTVLDFGCGWGETALGMALLKGAKHVVGIDLQTSMEKLAERSSRLLGLPALPKNLLLRQVRPGEIPVGPQKYDLIYSWSVVEHIDRNVLVETLRMLHDALADNGRIFTQIAPLYYSAYGHHVSWKEPFAWAHLTDESYRFAARTRTEATSSPHADSLWSCYETLNRLTAKELKDLFEDNGFFIEAQYRTKRVDGLPERLLYAYDEDVLACEQIVLLCSKKKIVSTALPPSADVRSVVAEAEPFHAAAAREIGGWGTNLPTVDMGFDYNLFDAGQVKYCADKLGSLHDFSVLEVGPRDGYHTYALERAGARVISVERDLQHYTRCLHIKNHYDLKATFVYGDAIDVARHLNAKFDLLYLCSVLHEFGDPIAALDTLCQYAERVFLWTPVFDKLAERRAKKFKSSVQFAKPFYLHAVPGHRVLVEASDITRLLNEKSFEIVRAEHFTDKGHAVCQVAARRTFRE